MGCKAATSSFQGCRPKVFALGDACSDDAVVVSISFVAFSAKASRNASRNLKQKPFQEP